MLPADVTVGLSFCPPLYVYFEVLSEVHSTSLEQDLLGAPGVRVQIAAERGVRESLMSNRGGG